MNHSENINELAAALSKAQSEINHARKDSKNPFFKSMYADLTACIDAARPALTENGIAICQFPAISGKENHCALTTMITHSSGQFMSSTMDMRPTKNDPQAIGSCLTYMRRYAFAAVVGLGQQDDDGNEASKKAPPAKKMKRDSSKFMTFCKKHGWTGKDCAKFLNTEFNKITDEGVDEIISHIEQGGMKV